MRLPSFRELSVEQDKIYNLPLTSNYLISGPPGTGKTVIALYRASMYKKQRKMPVLLSRSRLLSSYIEDAAESLEIEGLIKTYNSWVYTTYWKYFQEKPPQIEDYVFDWKAITPKLYMKIMADRPCLLIDEGQDLPPDFYASASLMSENLTVFADENQRITDTQSTFEDIRRSAGIQIEHKLTRNYRNTRQIAKVAACFYAGLPNGIPDIPDKEGPSPIIQNTKGLDDAISLICRFEKNYSHFQIGVFTKSIEFQQILLRRLEGRTKNPVEFFRAGVAKLPDFKTAGIKLISFASAKGLEFDAVFLPEMQYINMDMQMLENKMLFYVLLSRAREYLYMLYSGTGMPAVLELIPENLAEYR
ncbi:MAG TPA: 3'-5' exonuclease [Puia sp.]|nr:3'-5' exonuclease [Puia sp.]